MSYIHLAEDPIALASSPYSVTALRECDMGAIRDWRNAQIDALRQDRPLSDDDQRRYYRNVVVPSFRDRHTKILLVSFLRDGLLIGYGGLTNIAWDAQRAELSFLVDPLRAARPPTYEEDFAAFLALMKHVAFDLLSMHRLFAETYDIRPHHVEILERAGFRLEGRMRDHVRIDGRFVDALLHGLLSGD